MTDSGTDSTDSTDSTDGTMDPRWARVRPLVFRTIIGAVVAAGLVGIAAVLLGDFGMVAVQLLLTIVVVVVFALLSWYDADVSSRRSGIFAFASIATSMYLLVAGLYKVWIVPTGPDGDGIWYVLEHFWHWIWLVGVARVALLHVHLLLVIHRRYPTPVLQVVAKTTVGVIALLALLLSIPLLAPDVDYARGYWRLVWVVVILDLLGTVVVPLSNALFRPRAPRSSATWPVPDQQPAWGATPTPAAPEPEAAVPEAPSPPAPPAPAPAPALHPEPTPAPAPAPTPEPGTVVASDGRRYAARPTASRALAWPRYVDGTPLPALPDGTPDFSEVTER
ncbi:hypothetical protein [Curtobacterium flaccumfaciens]|uniref:hypothetical protein n=1 Tax=Curtobacterium flaccumfaciens TaxID=2035 RepID=UPI0011277425|nr:hypothetical protein [Curtobacterium flaccumfaciens]TPG06679.1 hypothetical protein EAH85_07960 [Curtobacterium flaccumfaciens]